MGRRRLVGVLRRVVCGFPIWRFVGRVMFVQWLFFLVGGARRSRLCGDVFLRRARGVVHRHRWGPPCQRRWLGIRHVVLLGFPDRTCCTFRHAVPLRESTQCPSHRVQRHDQTPLPVFREVSIPHSPNRHTNPHPPNNESCEYPQTTTWPFDCCPTTSHAQCKNYPSDTPLHTAYLVPSLQSMSLWMISTTTTTTATKRKTMKRARRK
mmetsp:Transcript_21414/g.36483  ORF Transcript_21414/g.36483 Transcript_21414/m.36483 type:complete len:208 (+) Transcript_21414:1254-1877(+)